MAESDDKRDNDGEEETQDKGRQDDQKTEDTSGGDDVASLKALLKTRNREAAALRQELGQAKKERDEYAERAQTDQEKAIAKAERVGEQRAAAKYEAELLESDVLRIATGRLRKPELAARLIDLSAFNDVERGEKRNQAIGEAIDALLDEEEYLGVSDNGERKEPAFGALSQGKRSPERKDQGGDWLRKSLRS
jgi:hypothetical protein